MVNEYSCTNVTFLSRIPSMNRDKASSRTDKLVNADNRTGSMCLTKAFAVTGAFMSQLFAACFTVGSTGACGWVNRG